MQLRGTREVLLRRYGLVFFDDMSEGAELPAAYEQAIEVELAVLAYAPSTRLAARLRRLPVEVLGHVQAWIARDRDASAFLHRILEPGAGDPARALPRTPVLAALYRNDVDLAEGSACYALRRERALDGVRPLAASDFLATS